MNLPDLNYECVHCGYSCQRLQVELSAPEYRELFDAVDPAAVRQSEDGRYWLRKQDECGSCYFLVKAEGGRCGLHRDRGAEAKPIACLEFPFRALSTPGGVFVGASYACQAIAQSAGPKLTSVDARVLEAPTYPLAPGVEMDWDVYLRWEARTLQLLREQGPNGLWSAGLEVTLELLGTSPHPPDPAMEEGLQSVFRGLLALAEGPMEQEQLLAFLQAHQNGGSYHSSLLQGPVNVGEVLARWQEPWSLWGEVQPFFEHLLFRKYLLEGPDVFSRICSLPILLQILEFLVLARNPEGGGGEDVRWALRLLEERLTFHARGLERYLGRCGEAFLAGLR